MNHSSHDYPFRYRWWIAATVVIAGGLSIFAFSKSDNVPVHFVTLLASVISVVFIVQKQRADDLQLFERIFTQFNTRYDKLHAELMNVATGQSRDLVRDREALDRYFNLCAEEFLFFREGRILPDVWQAWCRGIHAMLRYEPVQSYWQKEQVSGSHYGLTTGAIEQGARLIEPAAPAH